MTEKERGGGEDTYMCMIISAINMYVQHRYKQNNFLVTLTHTPVLVYRIATMTVMIIRFFLVHLQTTFGENQGFKYQNLITNVMNTCK